MSSLLWGVILTIIIDFVVLLAMVTVFCLFRKYRGNPDRSSKYEVFLNESSMPFYALCKKVLETNIDDIKLVCGDVSHNYLYLSKILAWFVTLTGAYSIIILLPIYNTGTENTEDLHNIGFSNITHDGNLLAGPFIVFILITLTSFYLIKLYVRETQQNHSRTTLNKQACRIIELPDHVSCKELGDMITGVFPKFPGNFYIVPKLDKALKYHETLEIYKKKLLHYLDYEKTYGTRESFRLGYFFSKKIDGIEYYGEKVEKYKKKLDQEYLKSQDTNSGVCILSSPGLINIKEIQSALEKDFPGAKVTPIVVPEDLKWENIDVDETVTKANSFCYTILFVYLFMFLVTPVAFLNYINDAFDGFGLSVVLLGFLRIFSPEVLLLIYQFFIIPVTVNFLIRKERHVCMSDEMMSALRKYLLFFLVDSLLVPALGMQAIEIVNLALDSDSFNEWSKIMAERINETSIWFMSFIISQSFIINGKELMQIMRLLTVRVNLFRAISEREKFECYLPEKMDYPVSYGALLSCFTAIIVYSISYPLILAFGSAYLWIRVIAI